MVITTIVAAPIPVVVAAVVAVIVVMTAAVVVAMVGAVVTPIVVTTVMEGGRKNRSGEGRGPSDKGEQQSSECRAFHDCLLVGSPVRADAALKRGARL
jgi:hypothetical protein